VTEEDEEFNRIEREATLRLKAVSAALKDHRDYLLKRMSEYERGVIEGRQMQVQSSVDKAVNALSKRKWVGLTDDEVSKLIDNEIGFNSCCGWETDYTRAVEAKLKEKNEM
jgi:hypothetical protein